MVSFLVCLVKMYKCIFFPVLGALGGAYCYLFGFGRFMGLYVIYFVFHLFRFCFGLNCSVLFCWWIVFGVVLFPFFFLGGGGGVFICFLVVCFALFVLECFCHVWFLSSCIFLVCFCVVLCVSWSGLGVVIVFLVCFACVSFYVCVCFFLFLMKITVLRAILVFWGWSNMKLCFSFQCLVLAVCFCFVCFCFKMFIRLFFCLFSCLF